MRQRPEPEHEDAIRLIRDLIEEAMETRLPTMATVVGGKAGTPVLADGITVQIDEEEDPRTISFPRLYGVEVRYGDRVALMASRSGEWVCLGPVGRATGANKKRVTGEEIAAGAITADGKQLAAGSVVTGSIANDSITAVKLQNFNANVAGTGAVSTAVIRDGAVTPAKLSQAYATAAALAAATSGLATETYANTAARNARTNAEATAASFTNARLDGSKDENDRNARLGRVARMSDIPSSPDLSAFATRSWVGNNTMKDIDEVLNQYVTITSSAGKKTKLKLGEILDRLYTRQFRGQHVEY
jgi:hypothetical protein